MFKVDFTTDTLASNNLEFSHIAWSGYKAWPLAERMYLLQRTAVRLEAEVATCIERVIFGSYLETTVAEHERPQIMLAAAKADARRSMMQLLSVESEVAAMSISPWMAQAAPTGGYNG